MFHPQKYPNQQSNPSVVNLLPNPWGLNCRFHWWAEKKNTWKNPMKKTKTSHYFEDETPPQQVNPSIKTWNSFAIFPYFSCFFPFPQNTHFPSAKEMLLRWQWIRCFIYIWVSSLPRIRGTRFRGWFLKYQGLKGDGFLSLVTGFFCLLFLQFFFEIPVNFLVVFGWLGWLLQILSYYFVGCVLFLKKNKAFFLAGDVCAVYVWESLARFWPLLMCWRDIVGTWVGPRK